MSNSNVAIHDGFASGDGMGQALAMQLATMNRPVRGIVSVVIEEDGVETIAHHKDNIFVVGGAKAMAHLFKEADDAYKITQCILGTQGHDIGNSDILTPVDPDKNDAGLVDTTDTYTKVLQDADSVYAPPGVETRVEYTITLEKAEGNGSGTRAYTEAGLFAANGTMICRETFPAAVKTDQRRMSIKWILVFD